MSWFNKLRKSGRGAGEPGMEPQPLLSAQARRSAVNPLPVLVQPKVLLVAVLNVAICFFAGRRSISATQPYDFDDVVNANTNCGNHHFIGGCNKCGGCESWEYAAGGCSYFKDRFCTLCEPIKNCPQHNIRCTDKNDHHCLECDAGYWGKDCKPCKACKTGLWETQECTQTSDAVCERCSECGKDQFTSTACTYFSDTKCTDCHHCVPSIDGWTIETCQTAKESGLEFPSSVYTVRPDTVCEPCTQPVHDGPHFPWHEKDGDTSHVQTDQMVTMICTEFADTKLVDCHQCPCDDRQTCQFMDEYCEPGDVLTNPGRDTKCKDCKKIRGGGKTDADFTAGVEWELFRCGGTSDAVFKPCQICMDGEYEASACSQTADTLCPKCNTDVAYGQLDQCKDTHFVCTNAQDTKCDECHEGWWGETCCYHRYYGSCGTMTTKERIPRRLGYEGITTEEFLDYCIMLCDEFPSCMAFEIEDGGTTLHESGNNSFQGKTAGCFFKGAFSQDALDGIADATEGGALKKEAGNMLDSRTHTRKDGTTFKRQHVFRGVDPEWDCFSNVCRQNAAYAGAYDHEVKPREARIGSEHLEGTAYQAGTLTR